METRLLEYFVAVAGELSVTEAARRLYAAQSTVSAGLRSLETELGVQLLHRTTQTVQLTAAGEELLTEARGILDAVERLHVLASETASGQRGRLTLGTFTGQDLVHDLPSALRAFRVSRPHVDLRLISSQRGSTGYASRVGVEHALAERGLRRQVVAEIADVLAIPGYVATGMGVAVVPDIIDPVGCARLALAEPIAPWTISLATRRNASDRPAVAALIQELRSHVRQQHRERLRSRDAH